MNMTLGKRLFQSAIVLAFLGGHLVLGRCSTEEIHQSTSMCLRESLVQEATDPLVPVFNDSASVVNFCLRHISDIKSCITNVISPCTSDKRVKVIFGATGAALLAAYDGLCQEPNKNIDMTCAYEHAENISVAVYDLIHSVDTMDQHSASFSDLCEPVHALLHSIMAIYEASVEQGHCSEESKNVMHQYLATIVFPCTDVATTYYPCTLAQINVASIECYAKNGVIVNNALVPTPSTLSNADEMCGSKSTIQSCIKSHITRCLYEPQVTTLYGSAVEGFEAGYNCMCSPDNFDMILSCAATADVTTAMSKFTSSVHNHSIAGTLDKQTQCALENTMAAEISASVEMSCDASDMVRHWRAYISTVIYPCTETATACYPKRMFNGGETLESMRALLISFVGFLFCLRYL
ncbi:uncharacterized protein LOC132728561 [Ruditapes philippinarum]|uniref:uncharacterized protein LOC132728561 n=1 Tax=Ruditapes philippinarum TaxID=129788 RepID=UPI00295C1C7C|nr:uncharacterized protein LOC132728561 [Ruditapes philippinarum]